MLRFQNKPLFGYRVSYPDNLVIDREIYDWGNNTYSVQTTLGNENLERFVQQQLQTSEEVVELIGRDFTSTDEISVEDDNLFACGNDLWVWKTYLPIGGGQELFVSYSTRSDKWLLTSAVTVFQEEMAF